MPLFYELWPEPLTTVAQQSWPQQIIELCGGDNLFAHLQGEYPVVSVESVLAAQPRVIVQPHDSARTLAWQSWRQWPELPAVKAHALLHPDADQLHRMTPRMLVEAERFCQSLDSFRPASGQ